MTRWSLLLLLLPFLGTAQKFTAADMKQLKLYSTGVFTIDAEKKSDSPVVSLSLHVQPIWQKRKDGLWLFANKTGTDHFYQVWHYYLQDDSTLVLQFFDFKDQQKAAQLATDVSLQAQLYLDHLFTSHGCDVYLKKYKTGFTGSTSGRECFTNIPGSEYLVLNIALTKDTLAWQQMPFDKENKEVATAVNGHFKYTRVAKPQK